MNLYQLLAELNDLHHSSRIGLDFYIHVHDVLVYSLTGMCSPKFYA